MTWQPFDTTIIGNQSQVLLDDQFIGDTPGEDLPNLAWFGIWCLQDAEGHYWNPAETDKLDDMENGLLGLAAQFADGWGVYVRRVVSSGKREYFFYYGGEADMPGVLPALQHLYPDYRIEFDSRPDPKWEDSFSWLKESPNA